MTANTTVTASFSGRIPAAVGVFRPQTGEWLLDLDGPCQNLPFTQAIGLTSSSGTVFSRFDKVLTGGPYAPCVISQIRPIDVRQLHIAQEAQRQIDAKPRETPAADH